VASTLRHPSGSGAGEFARARARAEAEAMTLRVRAARTVAGQALDHEDYTRLLAMLGLQDSGPRPRPEPDPEPDHTVALTHGLAGYVRLVAQAVRVPVEATGYEVSDTVTVYLALAQRWSRLPGRDLMLVWSQQHGWLVAVETDPVEPAMVIDYLGGDDVVPHPEEVARFVHEVVVGTRVPRACPAFPAGNGRAELAVRLWRYVQPKGPANPPPIAAIP
jgi:hypothetical protein